jgi:hypothetical protein
MSSGAVPADDPAVRLVAAFMPALGRFEQGRAGLGQQEAALAEQIGRARFALSGAATPPDATLTLRLSDGVVSG